MEMQNIEKELDSIIIAEINGRFSESPEKLNVLKVNEIIEERNREIVKIHQQDKIAASLPLFFKSYLQIREGGNLYFSPDDLSKKEFEIYAGKKGRLEVLLNASLNTLPDEELIHLIYHKRSLFDDEYAKAKEVMRLAGQAAEIRKTADSPDSELLKNDLKNRFTDEESAILYLNEMGALRAALQKIESRYAEVGQDAYIAEVVKRMKNEVSLAFQSMAQQSRKTSEFIFDQANTIFQHYKSVKSRLANIEKFVSCKEALLRYRKIFESAGDEDRKKQLDFFISTVEAGIDKLQKKIEKEKQREAAASEKDNQEVKEAYDVFLEIKSDYADRKLDPAFKRRRAVTRLKKSLDILKSNGQRVKAREIERFLNSTEMDKDEEKPGAAPQNLLFYKKAFMVILPLTICLAILNIYYMMTM
jgi:hypothetical protein